VARKPTVVVQVGLRIREALRRRVEQAAAKRGVSINTEIAMRLDRSFDQEAQNEIGFLSVHLGNSVSRLETLLDDLKRQGVLIRVVKELVLQVGLQDPKAIDAAVAQAKLVLKTLEHEAAKLPEKWE
jgi:hypothetical protein